VCLLLSLVACGGSGSAGGNALPTSPTTKPTTAPTIAPTTIPTVKPTTSPTNSPTVAPTATPTGSSVVVQIVNAASDNFISNVKVAISTKQTCSQYSVPVTINGTTINYPVNFWPCAISGAPAGFSDIPTATTDANGQATFTGLPQTGQLCISVWQPNLMNIPAPAGAASTTYTIPPTYLSAAVAGATGDCQSAPLPSTFTGAYFGPNSSQG
jgi:hypothetical protein